MRSLGADPGAAVKAGVLLEAGAGFGAGAGVEPARELLLPLRARCGSSGRGAIGGGGALPSKPGGSPSESDPESDSEAIECMTASRSASMSAVLVGQRHSFSLLSGSRRLTLRVVLLRPL